MDGKDCNWEPSNFNAKNLNADGEIYLVSDAYIFIYPYINEQAKDYLKVCVVEADELSVQIKNGIENIVNKFKTNNAKPNNKITNLAITSEVISSDNTVMIILVLPYA